MAELNRASVLAIKEESTVGTLTLPTTGSDFIPLRPGFSMSMEIETLENDELLNDIASAKSILGKEIPSGSHPIYLKNSEVEGQAPEFSLLLKSAFGSQASVAELDVIAGSTAGTSAARATLVLDTGEGATRNPGEAVLIKDLTNGYKIRNIQSISGDTASLNFNINAAPAATTLLGAPTFFAPVATGHPSYSVWHYAANGAAVQAFAGCRTTNISIDLPAAQQAECTFDFSGTAIFFNPITITATNKYLDATVDAGTVAAVLTEKTYKSPIALADEIASKLGALATGQAVTVTYSSNGANVGKFTIAVDAGTLSLLASSGANVANGVWSTIGFAASDLTLSTSYTGSSQISLAAGFTPSYDGASNLVLKNAELMIGGFDDNFCRDASNVSFTIGTPTTDVDDICAESGLSERLILERSAEMTATLYLTKHEVELFDRFLNNTDTEVMMNFGTKDNVGNWVPGKCVNIYFAKATVGSHTLGGDDIVELELTARGFVTSTLKDVYMNFI